MTRAVLSIGSNLGDRAANLRLAVDGLRDWLVAASGVYETAPWGDSGQPPYLNAVVLVRDATASPRDWLDRARVVERAGGRQRDEARRFGPRTLDVDVIAVWTADGEPVHSERPELTLPHPRAHVRAFVLRPWIDIEPYGRLPGHGWLADLLRAEPIAGQLAGIHPRPDVDIQSTR
jgi:2-amino-4-hydroxy-6-hydroxymethyldihydropteridine diphosphokinase